jgi:hypothetical protein
MFHTYKLYIMTKIDKNFVLSLVGATSGTISVYANAPAAPGNITLSKTSSTGYENCVSLGTPTAFAADTSNPPYDYKCTFGITANATGWPVGDNKVITISVYNDGGVTIGTVSVTLTADTSYLVTPESITLTSA